MMMSRAISSLAASLVSLALIGCAPPGQHYEVGEFFHTTPNDACQRDEMSSAGMLTWVNKSLVPNPFRSPAVRLSDMATAEPVLLSSIGIRLPGGDGTISCHVTITMSDGSRAGGVLVVTNPGAYAPLQLQWISDFQIAHELARVDNLANATNLPVKPDLTTPAIQACVGRATALGVGEEYPGQRWAACQAGNPR